MTPNYLNGVLVRWRITFMSTSWPSPRSSMWRPNTAYRLPKPRLPLWVWAGSA